MITREEAFTLWRDKLESYEQGTAYLHNDNKFCCLGVLCDLLKDELSLETVLERDRDETVTYYNHESSILPEEVAKFMGITPCGHIEDNFETLAELNDNGMTFENIKAYLYPNILKKADYHD